MTDTVYRDHHMPGWMLAQLSSDERADALAWLQELGALSGGFQCPDTGVPVSWQFHPTAGFTFDIDDEEYFNDPDTNEWIAAVLDLASRRRFFTNDDALYFLVKQGVPAEDIY